jgi:hypothetical protein
MKNSENVIWIIFGAGVIILGIFVMIWWYHANEKFCELSFCGKIEKITFSEKNYYFVKIENDSTFYLGNFVWYKLVPIEVGDSLIKKKNCYRVILRKKGFDYDIGSPIIQCRCDKENKDTKSLK